MVGTPSRSETTHPDTGSLKKTTPSPAANPTPNRNFFNFLYFQVFSNRLRFATSSGGCQAREQEGWGLGKIFLAVQASCPRPVQARVKQEERLKAPLRSRAQGTEGRGADVNSFPCLRVIAARGQAALAMAHSTETMLPMSPPEVHHRAGKWYGLAPLP
jgi:hypothetical protein